MKTIIKLSIAVAIINLSIATVKAQVFEKKTFVLNAGLGVGSVWGYNYTDAGAASLWPAISVSGEKGILEVKNIGIVTAGGEMAFRHVSMSNIDFNWTEFYVGTRGALHLTLLKVKNVDLYGGIAIGLRFYTEPTVVYKGLIPDWSKETHTSPYGGVFVGASYYFTKSFGAFTELGYEISFMKFGFVFKF